MQYTMFDNGIDISRAFADDVKGFSCRLQIVS